MFSLTKKAKRHKTNAVNPTVERLLAKFRTVKTIDDCLSILEAEGIFHSSAFSEEDERSLLSVVQHLRAEGMGLEPNLLGRTIARIAVKPAKIGTLSTTLAATDGDFIARMADGDNARDRGAFPDAEYRYWLALQYFPCHSGAITQYAHALKEQGKIEPALAYYFDAAAYADHNPDLEKHILFIAERLGIQSRVQATLEKRRKLTASATHCSPRDEVLTRDNVICLTQFLHGRTPAEREITNILSEVTTVNEALLALVGGADFSRKHRQLLQLISETGWAS